MRCAGVEKGPVGEVSPSPVATASRCSTAQPQAHAVHSSAALHGACRLGPQFVGGHAHRQAGHERTMAAVGCMWQCGGAWAEGVDPARRFCLPLCGCVHTRIAVPRIFAGISMARPGRRQRCPASQPGHRQCHVVPTRRDKMDNCYLVAGELQARSSSRISKPSRPSGHLGPDLRGPP